MQIISNPDLLTIRNKTKALFRPRLLTKFNTSFDNVRIQCDKTFKNLYKQINGSMLNTIYIIIQFAIKSADNSHNTANKEHEPSLGFEMEEASQ